MARPNSGKQAKRRRLNSNSAYKGLMRAQDLLRANRHLNQVLELLKQVAQSFESKPQWKSSIVSRLPVIGDQTIRCDICRRAIAETLMLLSTKSPKKIEAAEAILEDLYTALAALQVELLVNAEREQAAAERARVASAAAAAFDPPF